MYKILNIGGEEYKLEFSIEASLYNDCIEKITGLMYDISFGQSSRDIKQILSGVSDIPNTTVTCFYAGLMEHHGVEGDGTVPSRDVAKQLAVKLLKDEKNEVKNWYDLFSICLDQMSEDGFFELIGMSDILSSEVAPKRARKVPQDHRRKQTKTKDTEE